MVQVYGHVVKIRVVTYTKLQVVKIFSKISEIFMTLEIAIVLWTIAQQYLVGSIFSRIAQQCLVGSIFSWIDQQCLFDQLSYPLWELDFYQTWRLAVVDNVSCPIVDLTAYTDDVLCTHVPYQAKERKTQYDIHITTKIYIVCMCRSRATFFHTIKWKCAKFRH